MTTSTAPVACGFDADSEEHQTALSTLLEEINDALTQFQTDTDCCHQFPVETIEEMVLEPMQASEGGIG